MLLRCLSLATNSFFSKPSCCISAQKSISAKTGICYVILISNKPPWRNQAADPGDSGSVESHSSLENGTDEEKEEEEEEEPKKGGSHDRSKYQRRGEGEDEGGGRRKRKSKRRHLVRMMGARSLSRPLLPKHLIRTLSHLCKPTRGDITLNPYPFFQGPYLFTVRVNR